MEIKVYEAETLFQTVSTRAEQYKELKNQLTQLKQEFAKIVNNDQFLGNGADAIKGFYQAQIDVVEAWLLFINQNIAFLEGIEGTAEDKNVAGETVVKMPFLEEDLALSNKRANEIVSQQKEDLQTIFDDVSDLISLNVFSSEQFETYMDQAETKRTETIQKVNELDADVTSEYALSQDAESYVLALYSQLIDATRQGETISPLHFNAEAYKTSEIYQLKDDVEKQSNAYVTFKKEQNEARGLQKEIEAQANKPWYEKAWDTTKTFTGEITGYYDYKRATEGVDPVTGRKLSDAERIAAGAMAAAGFIPVVGWVGRAAKGGKAIYSTAKGMNAASHALDAYKTTKSLSILEKSEMGIYGLVAANGLSEAVTGKDMFGNELTEEQRQNSLMTALGIGGVAGAAKYVDHLQAKNALYQTLNGNKEIIADSNSSTRKLEDILKKQHLNVTEFNEIRLKPVSSLTKEETIKIKEIRRNVPPITKDTQMQKVLPPSARTWLFQSPTDGQQIKIGGFVAKVNDTKDLDTYDKIFEGLRLDYEGSPEWPNEFLTSDSALAIRFKATDPELYKIPFGGNDEDSALVIVKDDYGDDFVREVQKDPFTGNGFTKSDNYIIPEYKSVGKIDLYQGVELYEIGNNSERLIGEYNVRKKCFVSINE